MFTWGCLYRADKNLILARKLITDLSWDFFKINLFIIIFYRLRIDSVYHSNDYATP